jgi:hypothetical protein
MMYSKNNKKTELSLDTTSSRHTKDMKEDFHMFQIVTFMEMSAATMLSSEECLLL